MWRNKEIRRHVGVNFLILVLGLSAYHWMPEVNHKVWAGPFPTRGEAVLICMFAFWLGGTLHYTFARYRRIYGLYETLARIRDGAYHLDVRGSEEGELSILESEIYKLTLLLLEQAELLKKDKEFLADAISDISHQLKTPLTSMAVMVELLGKKDLPVDKRVDFTDNLQRQLRRMEWLLSSLLKMSRMDADAVRFKREAVNVKRMVERATRQLQIPMEIKGQTLLVKGRDDVTFQGDAQWTQEAVANLCKNAMEHTGEGGTIQVRFTDNPLYTQIIIEDDGKGIDEEDLPHVFERFYKGKNASKDSVGIGLALAKSIVAKQRGRLTVQSRRGEGTSFQIRFYRS